jgi:ABC-type glutathione transport system ATPase component
MLRIQEVKFGYRKGGASILDGVNLHIEAGECLGLLGRSGSGKSTLARVILQCPRPASGSVYFNGIELTNLGGKALQACRNGIQIVFQDPRSSIDPQWRVSSIIAERLVAAGTLGRKERARRVAETLDLVGLKAEFCRYRPRELSGGQCQRVAIARAIVLRPELLICDEAIASLDGPSKEGILTLLRSLQEEMGLACLFISHDLDALHSLCSRVAVLHEGSICESGRPDDIFRSPSHPATTALIQAAREFSCDAPPWERDASHGELNRSVLAVRTRVGSPADVPLLLSGSLV